MLSSKANAALMRVKEIETKYKLKRKEQKWNREQESDSPISSVSMSPSENLFEEVKKPPRSNTARPKLEIKMPNTRFEEDAGEANFSRSKNSSILDGINSKSEENSDKKPEPDTAISLENKSSPFIVEQESSGSTVTTIQENSSTKDESDNPSKSLSRSKTLQENLSRTSEVSQYEEKPIAKYERTNKSDKSSKGANEAQSSDPERSRASEKSRKKTTSDGVYFDSLPGERSVKQETVVKLPEMVSSDQNSKRSDRSEFSRDNSITEESISTIEDVSEIKSELSPADETIADKIEDSVDASKYSENTVASQNASAPDSSSSKRLAVESKYVNDTFEDISNSSNSSFVRSNAESRSEKKPIDEGKKLRDSSRSSTKENDTSGKDVPSSTGTLVVEVATNDEKTSENKSSSEIKIISVRRDGDHGETSRREKTRESATDVSGSPAMNDEDKTVSGKSSSSREESEPEDGNEYVLEKDVDSRIHEDAEYAMRRLRIRDAIEELAKRHARETERASESSSKSGTKTRGVTKVRRKAMTRKEEEARHSLENNETVNSDNSHERSTKRKRKGPKVANVKSTDARDSIERRGKDGALNGKQMLRFQKRTVELRLREERETLQKYINELRNSRPEMDSSRTYFYPLEFPNIAEFTEPGVIELESTSVDQRAMLQERVLAIRRWMKDQYILYRDYCSMARAINAHYTPTTLENAKKTIRDLRKTTIKAR